MNALLYWSKLCRFFANRSIVPSIVACTSTLYVINHMHTNVKNAFFCLFHLISAFSTEYHLVTVI